MGRKKKTIEEANKLFESKGFTLLSTEYKNSSSPLNYICSNGHITKIGFAELQRGKSCLECSGWQKRTIKEVRELFAARGHTLLSTEYKNNSSPLNYLCSNGHNATINFNSLQKGIGCAECAGLKTKTIEEVRNLFESRNFTLLSPEYKSSKSPLNYLCDQGHQTKISFNSLHKGNGCAECAGVKKKTFEEVRELFAARGHTLLSTEYKNNSSPLNYLCSNGHNATINFSSLQKGRGCAECADYGFSPNKSATLYYLRFQYEGEFYYKIGITNNTASKRFQGEKTSYTVIKETVYPVGKNAYTQEQAILKKFARWRYKGKTFLVSGNTELFTIDVLQLDSSVLYSC